MLKKLKLPVILAMIGFTLCVYLLMNMLTPKNIGKAVHDAEKEYNKGYNDTIK